MKKYTQKNNKENYTNHWSTPKDIYNKYIKNGYIDPIPLHSIIDPVTYENNEKLFINPPYSNITDFVDMVIRLHKKYNKEIILLVPSRTDTKWFHKLLDYGIEIEFIKGRLKFGDSKQAAPFPSIIIKIKGEKKNEEYIKDLERTIRNLDNVIDELQNNIDELKNDINDLEDEIDELEKEIKELRK